VPSAQLAQPQSRRSDRVATLPARARRGTLADAVLSLQRSAGNAAVVHLLARQPRDPWEENQPPETGRQTGDEPGMTGCSVVRKGKGWYVKCEHETKGPGPSVPTDPGSVRKPKPKPKAPHGPLTNPDQGPWTTPPPSLAEICERNPKAPICFNLGTGSPEPRDLPAGRFHVYDVLFEHARPISPQGGMTSAGTDTLAFVVERLAADPTMQVQLVGHASSEGTAAENLQLSVRRAKAVNAALAARGLGARVQDLVGERDPAGCTRVEFGIWACGATQAVAGEVRPEDRKVTVTFLRNAL